jgi:hypothetical protein
MQCEEDCVPGNVQWRVASLPPGEILPTRRNSILIRKYLRKYIEN